MSGALRHPSIDRLGARLAALAPRERALLAAGLALACLWTSVDAHDRYLAATARAAQAERDAARARDRVQLYGRADLLQRVSEETGKARRWTLSSPTAALAELELEDALQTAATEAGLGNATIVEVAGDERPENAPVRMIVAGIEGDFDRAALFRLVRQLARAEISIAITTIDVSDATTPPRVMVTAEAVFVAPGALT